MVRWRLWKPCFDFDKFLRFCCDELLSSSDQTHNSYHFFISFILEFCGKQDSSSWFSGELLNDPKGNNSLLMFSFLKSVANEYKKELVWPYILSLLKFSHLLSKAIQELSVDQRIGSRWFLVVDDDEMSSFPLLLRFHPQPEIPEQS